MPFLYDSTYYILIPAIIISLIAQFRVGSVFRKYNVVKNKRGYTGVTLARELLDQNGLSYIRLERTEGKLSDHYDSKNNVIRLSGEVFQGTSVAALGIAAHEVGHAVQYAKEYYPIRIRNSVIPATQIGSSLAFPLAFLGIIMSMDFLITMGIMLFAAVVFFQLVTLPVEFNASARALASLKNNNILSDDELDGARKVLSAAAMTYIAALIVAVANLLRLLALSNRRR